MDQRMKVAQGQTFDGLLYDLTAPDFPVEIALSEGPGGKTVVWVNVGPACVLRICRADSVTVEDRRV